MEITAKQKAENAILWIDRLSRTQVKQGQGELGNSAKGYCCLGYGCKVLKIGFNSYDVDSSEFSDSIGLMTNGGRLKNGKEFDVEIGVLFVDKSSLIDLNDDCRLSFRRISTQIKRNIEDLFEPEVAEILIKHYSKK